MFQFLQQQIKKDIPPRSMQVISDSGREFFISHDILFKKIIAGKGGETNND
jgi:hypothetical protein